MTQDRIRPRRTWLLSGIGVVTIGVLIGLGVAWRSWTAPADPCSATIGSTTYHLDREQAANATTIAAVARDLGLAHHAVTIGLAAALQESNLHNLSHGDRDSVGLFQQRPSQGWGTVAQLLDPRYATAAFYRGLERVPGWETIPVTDAAQRVQRSNAPQAYAQWEGEARLMARLLTAEVPGGIVCP